MRERYDNLDIAALRPSLFDGADENMDRVSQEIFDRSFRYIAKNYSDYFVNRFVTAAFYYPSIFTKALGNVGELTACEIGSGGGFKAAAWAPLFRRYIAVDIDVELEHQTQRMASSVGIRNVETVTANGAQFVHDHLDEIDVLILYAVVEHLTIAEREIVLAAVEAHWEAGGVVLIAEMPNRLLAMDSHTTQLPFFQSLPDELALRYIERSPILDWIKSQPRYTDDPREHLYRLGRGVSYHEFELFCPKAAFSNLEILNDGYDAPFLNIEPLQRDEIRLDAFLGQAAPAIPRAFSRYWIEILARGGEICSERSRLRFAERSALTVAPLIRTNTHWDFDRTVVDRGDAEFLACGADRVTVTVDLATSVGGAEILVDGNAVFSFDVDILKRARPPIWHERCSFDVALPPNSETLAFRSGLQDGQIVLGPVLVAGARTGTGAEP